MCLYDETMRVRVLTSMSRVMTHAWALTMSLRFSTCPARLIYQLRFASQLKALVIDAHHKRSTTCCKIPGGIIPATCWQAVVGPHPHTSLLQLMEYQNSG